MRIGIVSNPVSGGGAGRRVASTLASALSDRLHDVRRIDSEVAPASQWLAPHLDGLDVLAVVGGDGTVRSVVQCLADASVPMVHVPQGNENLLARGLGMFGALGHSIALLEEGTTQVIDLARANGEDMVLMASGGFDAMVVHHVAATRRHRVSHGHYVRGCLASWMQWTPPQVTIDVDGRRVVDGRRGWMVIANAPDYAWRLDPARMARLDDGMLDVVFLPMRTRLGLLSWLWRCRRGTHHHHEACVQVTGRHVRVELDPPQHWQIDGDPPQGRSPAGCLEVAIEAGRLPVLVFPGSSGALVQA